MDANEADARRRVESGSKRWAVAFAVLGVLVTAAPFVAGAHAMWTLLGVGLGVACFAVALAVASDAALDGPPPRRSA